MSGERVNFVWRGELPSALGQTGAMGVADVVGVTTVFADFVATVLCDPFLDTTRTTTIPIAKSMVKNVKRLRTRDRFRTSASISWRARRPSFCRFRFAVDIARQTSRPAPLLLCSGVKFERPACRFLHAE